MTKNTYITARAYKSPLTTLLLSVNFIFHERHTDTTHIYLHMTKNTYLTARAYKSLLSSLSLSVTEAELVTYASNVSVYVCVRVGVSVSVCVYDRGGTCNPYASNVSVYVCLCLCLCLRLESVTQAELVTYVSNVGVYVCVCGGVSVSVCVCDRGGTGHI